MRTVAQKTASQIALINCFKEAVGKDSIYVILIKGEYKHYFFFLSFLFFFFFFGRKFLLVS